MLRFREIHPWDLGLYHKGCGTSLSEISSSAHSWRRWDKTGAVGGMLVASQQGGVFFYRPPQVRRWCPGRAVADKRAGSCRVSVICGFMSKPVSLHLLGIRDLYLSFLEMSVWVSVFLSACVGIFVYPPESLTVFSVIAYSTIYCATWGQFLHYTLASRSKGKRHIKLKEIVLGNAFFLIKWEDWSVPLSCQSAVLIFSAVGW